MKEGKDPGIPGTLYVVSTPIGNLGDLSSRAVETLRAVDAVLAEDTRHSRVLLDRNGVKTRAIAYHEHNESKSAPGLVGRLLAGESFALISDAGTPLLSDPGGRLVSAAIDAGIRVSPVPGPSALLAALVGAGLPSDTFTFFGFPPRKGGDRTRLFAAVAALPHTAVLYEAPGRVGATLAGLAEAGAGEHPAVVARELTKQFEEFVRGTVAELASRFSEEPPRGEVAIVIAGLSHMPPAEVDEEAVRARAQELRAEGLSARAIARVLSEEGYASRNVAYRLALE